jgi:tripartite-type tricarboxylate transporter receptor subunit TctC
MKLNAGRMAAAAFAAFIAMAPISSQAQQDYPNKEIHVYVGFAAGTGADILARYFADKLAALTGKPSIMENKPGAFGNIAAEAVARAKNDGYHLLITPGSGTHSNNPHLFKKLPFDPIKDFTPITTLARQGFILVVDPKTPIKTVADLTAHLKQKGAKASYGAPNPFSLAAAELYKTIAGVQAERVNYTATPQSISELLDGSLDFVFADSVFAMEQVRSGRIRALAVTMDKRALSAPEIPTMAEQGVPGYSLTGWWAAYFPANTPKPIADKMEAWLNQIDKTEETAKFLINAGNEPFPGNRDFLVKWQAEDYTKWGKIHEIANIPKL